MFPTFVAFVGEAQAQNRLGLAFEGSEAKPFLMSRKTISHSPLLGSTSPIASAARRRRTTSGISAINGEDTDEDSVHSPGSFGHSHSDVVLVRCRDTIERLYNDVETERKRCTIVHEQVSTIEADLRSAHVELAEERVRRGELEAHVNNLEWQLKEAETRLRTQRQEHEALSEQLQKLKAESVQKTQDAFVQGLKLTELEGAVCRSDARAAAAQEELRETSNKLTSFEAEVSSARALAAAETLRADRTAETHLRTIDELQASMESMEESHRQQMHEVASREERLRAAWREHESELRRGLLERDEAHSEIGIAEREADEARQQARRTAEEKRELQGRYEKLESEVSHFRSKVETVQRQLQERSDEIVRVRAADASAVSKLEQQVEEGRRQLRERLDELQRISANHSVAQRQADEAKQEILDLRARDTAREAAREERQTAEKQRQTAAQEQHTAELRRASLELEQYQKRATELEERKVEFQRTSQSAGEGLAEAQAQTAELTWRLEVANKELDRCRAGQTAERSRSLHLEERLRSFEEASQNLALHAPIPSRAAGPTAISEVAIQLAQAKQQAEDARLLKMKQKYEQKIAKMYRHLSDRESHERSLKAFIENEVEVLHSYNQELDRYCRTRQGQAADSWSWSADKAWRRVERNMRVAGC